MSEVLQGWVECRNTPSAWFSKSEWVPAIDVEALLTDDVSLLARPPFSNTAPPGPGPLEPGKGLPPDVSELVAREAGRWRAPWFCSYPTWVQLLPLRQEKDLPSDWRLVLTLMETLASSCGEENVRLIVWTYISDYS